jgi:hypothetical protein
MSGRERTEVLDGARCCVKRIAQDHAVSDNASLLYLAKARLIAASAAPSIGLPALAARKSSQELNQNTQSNIIRLHGVFRRSSAAPN